MGRATIAGGGTDGLFTIDLDFGTATRDALAFVLTLRINELTAQIGEQTIAVDQAAADTQAARVMANLAVQAFASASAADPGGDHSALIAAVSRTTVEAGRLAAIEAQRRVKRDLLTVDRTELQREKGRLESATVSDTKAAWCVDLTESAGGAVATIEIPGEDQAILLAPGCRAPTPEDGQLLAREVMTPAQAFFNAAILPGWQKWSPTYRKGTITAINKLSDRASVSLDATTSSAAGLGVNRAALLSDVPVIYMTCNAEVFEVGDRVVVEFQGMAQEAPRVIGFVDHPKSCAIYAVTYVISFTSPPAEGMTFPPAVVISNNGGISFVQYIIAGGDCVPVSLLNTDITGNTFSGWSDGIGSPSRHDLEISEAVTYTAAVIHTPASAGVRLVTGLIDNGVDPAQEYAGISCLASLEYVRVSMPETRYKDAASVVPGFRNFDGETITLSHSIGGSMTFVISGSDTGMFALRV